MTDELLRLNITDPKTGQVWSVPFPTTDDELWEFVATVTGVQIPRVAICPSHVAPFTAFADAYFARHPVMVWKASRGFGGKSFLLALLSWMEAVCLGAGVSILGGSLGQSQNVHRYSREFWDYAYAPKHLLVDEPTKIETHLNNGGYQRVLAASQRSVRGPHVPRLRLDEIDEMDLAILDASLGQTMESRKGIPVQTVMSSTHQYPEGTMTAILKRARERDWRVCEWCYRENMEPYGWLSSGQVTTKRIEVTQAMWDTEYELQEPSVEGRVLAPEIVERLFDPKLGIVEGKEGVYYEFEEPKPGYGPYVTGGDWAKTQDWTVIATFRTDVQPWRCVAWERMGRRSWPEMLARMDFRRKRFPGSAAHDSTGIGQVVHDFLTTAVEPVVMVGQVRQAIFNDYVVAIENNQVVYPRIIWAYDEHRYCRVVDLQAGQSGHPPDSFVAGCMAYYCRAFIGTGIGPIATMGNRLFGESQRVMIDGPHGRGDRRSMYDGPMG